jgi:hypothetical protein
LDRPEIIGWLMGKGVRRLELNNVPQGLELQGYPGWSFSLHLPEVLLSVMRPCPGEGEDFRSKAVCPRGDGAPVSWDCHQLPASLIRRDNGLYYQNAIEPPNMSNTVDRIVIKKFGKETHLVALNP